MGTSLYGGCRDQMSGGSCLEVWRRKDYYLDGDRNGDRQRSRRRDPQDRLKDRQRDIKVKESMNGCLSSALSKINSGGADGNVRKLRWFVRGSVDREPGELCLRNGSDDPESRVIGDYTVSKFENGALPSLNGKRKFSMFLGDRDDKKQLDVALAQPPLQVHGYIPPNSMEILRPCMAEEPELMEEKEEYPLARSISASRWAYGNNAFPDDDEAEASDEEFVSKRRKSVCLAGSEFHEVILREGSEGAASKSSNSGGEHGYGSRELKEDRHAHMEVDREESDGETDSESKDCRSKTVELVRPPQRTINMLQGCRSVNEFEKLNKIGEGTYGVVYRAKDKKTGEIVALKKVKMEKEQEGFPLTSLREINILLSFHNPSIVDVKEVVMGSSLDTIFMVMEYMEHDLKRLMDTMKQPFTQSEVKCLMLQLFAGVKYLHDNWVLHRDLKTSNLLFNNKGELKICDFGLSRQYGSPLKPYTPLVVTLCYRAPELLLGAQKYSTAIDMWSLGCIMAELLAKEPLFSGKTEVDQLTKIFQTLGTPNESIWPDFAKLARVKVGFSKQPYNKLREKFPPTSFSGRPALSEAGFDLLNKLLTYDPETRITAEAALNHDWFHEVPLPKSKDFMPTFPPQHA